MTKACFACGRPWTEKRSPGFREECEGCGQPLYCCANCRFYHANAAQWCGEPMARANKPRDPKQANHCDYFLFAERKRDDTPPATTPQDRPDWMHFDKKNAKDIFKD